MPYDPTNEKEMDGLLDFFHRSMAQITGGAKPPPFKVEVEVMQLGATRVDEPRKLKQPRVVEQQTLKAPLEVYSIDPTEGTTLGGTEVTIYGAGFLDDATVQIGSVDCTIVSIDIDQIVVKTGAHPADGDVNVKVISGGETAVLSLAFHYYAPPNIDSITPTSGPIAGGTPVDIYGSKFRAGMIVFLGDSSTSLDGLTPDGNHATLHSPAGHATGKQDVIVQNPDGQQDKLVLGWEYTGSVVTGVPFIWCIPHDIQSGPVYSVQAFCRTADDGGGSVVDYTGNLTINAEYDPDAMTVATNPAAGSTVAFSHGVGTFLIQAISNIAVTQQLFVVRFTNTADGINVGSLFYLTTS